MYKFKISDGKILKTSDSKEFFVGAYALNDWNFITRKGNKLYDGNKNFRFAGTNLHWLGYYTRSQFQINEGFLTAHEMGCNVVRSHTLGISTGYPGSLEPELNVFDPDAFENIDYSYYLAKEYGIRLIIPLVDDNYYYQGGKHDFTEWRGIPEDDFYTNATVIQDYKNYISNYLNHVNVYTGIALKNDPTVLAFETGNELRVDNITWGSAQDAWTQDIATYIKSIAPNALVSDGHQGLGLRNYTAEQLANSKIDLLSDHGYPIYISTMQTNAAAAAANNKCYYIGEFDWTDVDNYSGYGTITQDVDAYSGSHAAKITITKAVLSDNMRYYVQLRSNTFTLTANSTYTINFYVKSSSNSRLTVELKSTISPYTTYSTNDYTLTPEYTNYSFTYTAPSTVSNVWLTFNCAADVGTILLDSITASDGTNNLITPMSFENTGSAWLAPWSFKLKANNGSMLSEFLPVIEADSNTTGSLFWHIFVYRDLHKWDRDGADNYTLHYPGLSPDHKNRAQRLRSHIFTMREITNLPKHITPAVPKMNYITISETTVEVDFRGSAGSGSYILQQSLDNLTWNTVFVITVEMLQPTIVPINTANGTFFRVLPVSLDGEVTLP